MENNDSPYIYEKPLRAGLKQRSKRLAGLSALGLVGMVGIFGGSAFANTLAAANPATATSEADPVEIVDPLIENTDISGDPLVSTATVEPTSEPAPLVSIPLQEAKPKPNSVKVELPAKFASRGERHERYESSNDSDEREYKND